MATTHQAILLRLALRERRGRRLPRPRRIYYPATVERQYKRDLLAMLAKLDALTKRIVIPRLASVAAASRRELGFKADAFPDQVDDYVDDLRLEFEREFTPAELQALVQRTGRSVDHWNRLQMRGALKTVIDLNVFGGEPWLASAIDAFAVQNVDLITSIPERYFAEIKAANLRMLRQGVRWEEIASEFENRYEVSQSRAELLARDQIGKLQGQLTEGRQKDLGLKRYTWRTAGDDRVRPTHAAHDGKVFEWSDPPSDTGHPGQDFQCRCYGEPVLDDVLDQG